MILSPVIPDILGVADNAVLLLLFFVSFLQNYSQEEEEEEEGASSNYTDNNTIGIVLMNNYSYIGVDYCC